MGHNEPIREGPSGSAPSVREERFDEIASANVWTGEIPDKLYFRIGDVAEICDVPAYVLRFWETEFPQLKPNKGGTGQRLYRRRDVEVALKIKRLLYREGYTIPGARHLLKVEQRQPPPQLSLLGAAGPDPKKLKGIRRELEGLLAMLSRPAGSRAAPQSIRHVRRGQLPAEERDVAATGAAEAASVTGEIPFDPPLE